MSCGPSDGTDDAWKWWCDKLEECIWNVPLGEWPALLTPFSELDRYSLRLHSVATLLGFGDVPRSPHEVRLLGGSLTAVSTFLKGGPQHWLAPLANIETDEPSCRVLRRCAAFVATPSPDLLSSVLLEVAGDWPARLPDDLLDNLPWPLESLLRHCTSPQITRELAEQARSGIFGSASDWSAAEGRWASGTISDADIRAWDEHDCLPGAYLRFEGFAVAEVIPLVRDTIRHATHYGKELADLFERSKSARLRHILGTRLVSFFAGPSDAEFKPGAGTVDSWLSAAAQPFVMVDQLARIGWSPEERLAIYSLLCVKAEFWTHRASHADVGFVLESFILQPETSPLVRMLACWARSGTQFVLPRASIERLWSRQEYHSEAASVMAAQQLLTSTEARRLVGWLAASNAGDDDWWNLIRAASEGSAPDLVRIELALAAHEFLGTSSTRARASTIEMLDGVLLRRKSLLSDPLACEQLGLRLMAAV